MKTKKQIKKSPNALDILLRVTQKGQSEEETLKEIKEVLEEIREETDETIEEVEKKLQSLGSTIKNVNCDKIQRC